MNYKSECLYCGQPGNMPNHSCDCNKNSWCDEYRMIDIAVETNRRTLTDSFRNYSFKSPEGLLQYKGLPFRHIISDVQTAPGLTSLYNLRRLGDFYGCNLFLKNEGENPSGCFKDRETMICLLNSIHNGLKRAVIYSSGNAAASAAYFTEQTRFQLLAFVAGDTYPEKIEYIRNHGADVIVIGDEDTNFETGYRLFTQMKKQQVFSRYKYDNWSVRNPFRVQGDKTTALEIVKQLSTDHSGTTVPDYVTVPTANGSCLAGIWKGFKELYNAGLIATLPAMIPTGIEHANPVCKAVRLGQTDHPVKCDLSEMDEGDAEAGSIIVAEEGYDSIEAARAVIESGGFPVELHTADIQHALVHFFKKERSVAVENNILPEPASLTSLAAVHKMKQLHSLSRSDIVVSIATGDGAKAEHLLASLLKDEPAIQTCVKQMVAEKQNGRAVSATKGRRIGTIEADANMGSVMSSFVRRQKRASAHA